jgi:CHC2-type zinc finger protein
MARARITHNEIAALKVRLPLPSLIGESVALRQETRSEFVALCPFHVEDTPSFRVYRDHAHCFGCGWHGDAITWLMERERMSFPGAVRHLREWTGHCERLEADEIDTRVRDYGWTPIIPVPIGAPPLIASGFVRAFNPKRAGTSWEWTRWRPVLAHPYRDTAGMLLGYVLRVEYVRDGRRHKFTPTLTYCEDGAGERRWCVIPFPRPRPLYRLDGIAARPDVDVLLVEGEKTADAARRLLPDMAVTTWPGGAKAYHLADLAPLRGRRVIGVPDADKEGRAAFDGQMTEQRRRIPGLLELLTAAGANASRIEPPIGLPDGWDLADALADGWGKVETACWVRAHMRSAVHAG